MGAVVIPNMPVGYRFHPTDEEYVDHYLKNRVRGLVDCPCIIPDVDICKWDPWELPKKFHGESIIGPDDKVREWWFFCPQTPQQVRRSTPSGFWKKTGTNRNVKARGTNRVIGTKKTLVFHEGRGKKGVKTNWVIHEYHITKDDLNGNYVLCHLKDKGDEKADDLTTESELGAILADFVSFLHQPDNENSFPEPLIKAMMASLMDPSFQALSRDLLQLLQPVLQSSQCMDVESPSFDAVSQEAGQMGKEDFVEFQRAPTSEEDEDVGDMLCADLVDADFFVGDQVQTHDGQTSYSHNDLPALPGRSVCQNSAILYPLCGQRKQSMSLDETAAREKTLIEAMMTSLMDPSFQAFLRDLLQVLQPALQSNQCMDVECPSLMDSHSELQSARPSEKEYVSFQCDKDVGDIYGSFQCDEDVGDILNADLVDADFSVGDRVMEQCGPPRNVAQMSIPSEKKKGMGENKSTPNPLYGQRKQSMSMDKITARAEMDAAPELKHGQIYTVENRRTPKMESLPRVSHFEERKGVRQCEFKSLHVSSANLMEFLKEPDTPERAESPRIYGGEEQTFEKVKKQEFALKTVKPECVSWDESAGKTYGDTPERAESPRIYCDEEQIFEKVKKQEFALTTVKLGCVSWDESEARIYGDTPERAESPRIYGDEEQTFEKVKKQEFALTTVKLGCVSWDESAARIYGDTPERAEPPRIYGDEEKTFEKVKKREFALTTVKPQCVSWDESAATAKVREYNEHISASSSTKKTNNKEIEHAREKSNLVTALARTTTKNAKSSTNFPLVNLVNMLAGIFVLIAIFTAIVPKVMLHH